jgi:hypothetical protein
MQPRTKDHWSLRLRIKRPNTATRTAAGALALAQTLLLTITASSLATGGGLYGCTSACGTTAQPATPALAVFFGILMLVLPVVIGALCEVWQTAVAFAVLPWFPALLIGANSVLAPTNTIKVVSTGRGALPTATSQFGPPFWLDAAHLPVLLFSLALFALLGWLGWVVGQAVRGEV